MWQLWDEKVLAAMAKTCDRPMIFPMSNPTDRAECTAAEAAEFTQNRYISQFQGTDFCIIIFNLVDPIRRCTRDRFRLMRI
jgi:hypothetical protein